MTKLVAVCMILFITGPAWAGEGCCKKKQECPKQEQKQCDKKESCEKKKECPKEGTKECPKESDGAKCQKECPKK